MGKRNSIRFDASTNFANEAPEPEKAPEKPVEKPRPKKKGSHRRGLSEDGDNAIPATVKRPGTNHHNQLTNSLLTLVYRVEAFYDFA